MNKKTKTWSYEQTLKYEVALDIIGSLGALLRRQSRVIADKERIVAYDKRELELHNEKELFDGFDDDIVADVIKTYSKLVNEYYDMGDSEEEIAEKGLPQRFIYTRVEYAKYKKGKINE